MMKTVWKFQLLPLIDVADVEMPAGAELLHVDYQNDGWFLWALVNPDAPKQKRRFRVAGTGHPIDWNPSYSHVGSCLSHDGHLVFHCFEIRGSAE